jgi:single-stranded-DNA-specific exonuclease
MTNQFSQGREKKWLIRESATQFSPSDIRAMSQTLGRSEIVTKLLWLRGYQDAKSASDFLGMKCEMLCDPREMKDMEAGVDRIVSALEKQESIVIYGDYDVDGVTAVCTLYLYLRSKGANISYYIPNRTGEGYGVSIPAVDKLISDGVNLIITVDTGITAGDEVAYAKTKGVDFVVTDHHECRAELPEAVAVINPHRPDDTYPFKELAGVGVVFKLLCALEMKLSGDSLIDSVRRICMEYADLVAIGTVADVMPVRGENKLIIKLGLSLIENTSRPGLCALLDAVSAPQEGMAKPKKKTKISSGFIGYTIAPRINAAGRIRSASIAADMFLADDMDVARELAEELCIANKERQSEENRIMQEAYAKIDAEHDFEHDPVIILDSDTWHHGVIGIVSSRITEHYGLPSILISFEGAEGEGDEAVGKGSGRSIKGMNLVDALVHASSHLVKFGGHELAAGLSVSRGNLAAFKAAVNEYARSVLSEEALTPCIEADMEISLSDISMPLAEELQLLEPYGVGNAVPVFCVKDLYLSECNGISGGKHARLVVSDGEKNMTVMYFSHSPSDINLHVGDRVDIIFTLDINEYNGRRSVQLIARDVRLAESVALEEKKEQELFREIWSGITFSDESLLPTRDDFSFVYKVLNSQARGGMTQITLRALLLRLRASRYPMGYVKLKLIIKIFQELNFLGIEEVGEDTYRFRDGSFDKKNSLDKSNLFRRLRNQYKPN